MQKRIFLFVILNAIYASIGFASFRFQATKEFQVGGNTAIGYIAKEGHEWLPDSENQSGIVHNLKSLKESVYYWYKEFNSASASLFNELDFGFEMLIRQYREDPIIVLKQPSSKTVFTLGKIENAKLLDQIDSQNIEVIPLDLEKEQVVEKIKPKIPAGDKKQVPIPDIIEAGVFKNGFSSRNNLIKAIEVVLNNDPRVADYIIDLPSNLIKEAGEKTPTFTIIDGVPHSVHITRQRAITMYNLHKMQVSRSQNLRIGSTNHVDTPVYVAKGTDGHYALFRSTSYGASYSTFVACVIAPILECKIVHLELDETMKEVILNGKIFNVGRIDKPQKFEFSSQWISGDSLGRNKVGMWRSGDRNPQVNSYKRVLQHKATRNVDSFEYLWNMDLVKPFLPFGKATSFNAFEDPETGTRYLGMHLSNIKYQSSGNIRNTNGTIILKLSKDYETFEL